jgi:hypothetical protein
MDGNVILSNSETTGGVSLEQAAVATVKTEETLVVNQIQQQPDIKPPNEESPQVGVQ